MFPGPPLWMRPSMSLRLESCWWQLWVNRKHRVQILCAPALMTCTDFVTSHGQKQNDCFHLGLNCQDVQLLIYGLCFQLLAYMLGNKNIFVDFIFLSANVSHITFCAVVESPACCCSWRCFTGNNDLLCMGCLIDMQVFVSRCSIWTGELFLAGGPYDFMGIANEHCKANARYYPCLPLCWWGDVLALWLNQSWLPWPCLVRTTVSLVTYFPNVTVTSSVKLHHSFDTFYLPVARCASVCPYIWYEILGRGTRTISKIV